MGQTGNPPIGPAGSKDELGLHLRPGLSRKGKAAGLVMTCANAEAMPLHLSEISQVVAKGTYAIRLLDQADWHTNDKLSAPDKIKLLPLPPRSPELNSMKNVWPYLRDSCCRTSYSKPTTISSRLAAGPGTASPISLTDSHRSGGENGHVGFNTCSLV